MRTLLALLLLTPAHAQVVYEGCRDINGVPVGSIQAPHLNDIAMATIQGGMPIVFYNPLVLQRLPPVVHRFFYAHECAHHQLGHVVFGQIAMAAEQAADCWAAHAMKASGASEADFMVIGQAISTAQGDWTHLPGPQRAINLSACLAAPMPRPQPPPMARSCCDGFGMPRCMLMQPAPIGSMCGCPGLGYGRACP